MEKYFNYTDEFLTAKRNIGDPVADLFTNEIFTDPTEKQLWREWLGDLNKNAQLELLPVLYNNQEWIKAANQLPVWANQRMMQNGSTFFIRHSETIMTLLGLLSLPYCYTAANGAMVLYLSDRMRSDTRKRLYETAEFVWQVMAPNAFKSDGDGFAVILKVRAMHAAVRYYTLNSGKWNHDWGLPVNQEDMAGTNLSFSLIVIRGLRKLGYTVSRDEQQGFLHLWNVIGFLSGLNRDLLPVNGKQAQLMDTAISKRQFSVSSHGTTLTKSLTDHIISINTSKASTSDILGLMRYLLGADVSEMLSINAPNLPAFKLSIIKTINLVKSLKPQSNVKLSYQQAFEKFKMQKPQ
jgi:hypothetical protein